MVFLIIIERLGFKNKLNKLPALISTSYTLFIAIMAWVLFRANEFGDAEVYYKALFGFAETTNKDIRLILLLNNEFIWSLVLALFGAFGGFVFIKKTILGLRKSLNIQMHWIKVACYSMFVLAVMLLTTTYLANSTYNPFIYFRF